MRWMMNEYSVAEVGEILRQTKRSSSVSEVEAAFADVTGESFAALEQRYLDTAPEFFAPFDVVSPPTLAPLGGGWDIVLDFDCAQLDTEGYDDHMWRRVRIEVNTPGRYVLLVAPPATAATIRRHRTDDWQLGEPMPAPPSGPIGDDLFDSPESWLPDVPIETWLDVGLYDIEVHVPGVSPITAAVRIHPQLGPVSQTP